MNLKKLISELKRRNVFKVAMAYAIAGWLIIQIVSSVFPIFKFPAWTSQFVIMLVVIGFPISLIIAWAFELTPEGVKKTGEVDKAESITPSTGKKLNKLIIGVLSVAVIFLLIDRFFFVSTGESTAITAQSAAITDKSIAVLPFADFSPKGDQGWFADGLTEEILNDLVKTPDLQVASRTASFAYKGKNDDVTDIAKNLGVAYILEGSVRKAGEEVRVTVQLIQASDGIHLWSQSYDGVEKDIFKIQEDIAIKIANALKTAMKPGALKKMVQAGTTSVEAYNEYLKGLSLSHDDPLKSYHHFEKARTIDPDFSEASYHAALFWAGQLQTTRLVSGLTDKSYSEQIALFNERIKQAIAHANPVDKLKYQSSQAFLNLQFGKSLVLIMQYDNQRPNDISSLAFTAENLAYLGKYAEAYKYVQKIETVALNNSTDYSNVESYYYTTKHYDEAVEFGRKALTKFPYNPGLLYEVHRELLWDGRYDEARPLVERIAASDDSTIVRNMPLVRIRQACADGNVQKANQIYNTKLARDKESISVKWLALMLLNRKQEAYDLLKPIYDHDQLYSLSSWLIYPYFDATQFPKLQQILDREGGQRGKPVPIPFGCKKE
ncbi:MAG TPA: hypothetical protein VKA08_03090 [Balneolales bacterium]|nr:hypothetical protein [Balneolales bacterium]